MNFLIRTIIIMKKRYLSFLFASLLITGSSCKKAYDVDEDRIKSSTETAKDFFIQEVSINAPDQVSSNRSIDKSNINPRRSSIKSPVWERAYTTQLSIGEAIVVPVHFKNPF